MPSLTLTNAYQEIWVAKEWGLLPSALRLLDWEDQAELTAFTIVKGQIDNYYSSSIRAKLNKDKNT